jgi:hypothetical protein
VEASSLKAQGSRELALHGGNKRSRVVWTKAHILIEVEAAPLVEQGVLQGLGQRSNAAD